MTNPSVRFCSEEKELILDFSHKEFCKEFTKDWRRVFAEWLKNSSAEVIRFTVGGKDHYSRLSKSDLLKMQIAINDTQNPDDFRRTLDFIQESEDPIFVTHHRTHQCLLVNDLFEPDRLIWNPVEYMGLNLLQFWDRSMDDLDKLITTLNREGKAEHFKYKFRRVDGRMEFCVKSFYLLPNFLGAPVRLSISHEWRLIND